MTDIEKVEAFLGHTNMTIEEIMNAMLRRGFYTSISRQKAGSDKPYWGAWVMTDDYDEDPEHLHHEYGADAKKTLCKAIVECDGIIPKETK